MNMKRKLFSFGIAAGLTVLATASSARAESIPIVNPSFEMPPVKDGVLSTGGIPGWIFSKSGSLSNAVAGVANLPSGDFFFPTDGSQVGYFRWVEGPTGLPGIAGISQSVGANLEANTLYTLSVDFYLGKRYGSPHELSTAVRFWAGNALLTSQLILYGQTTTLEFFASANDPNVGRPISITIDYQVPISVSGTTGALFFDNVRLDATQVMAPPVLHGAFGLIGLLPHETARLNAFCDGLVVPAPSMPATPCEAILEFHDINGRLLQHSEVTLRPGTGGFLDQQPPPSGDRTAAQIVPSWRFVRGNAVASLELFDSSSLRTRILIDWGDGAVARTGEADFGLAAITPFDTGRLGAFCPAAEGDGSVTPAPCDVMFEFHDSTGRMLKQSSMTLRPGTGGFLDLTWPETGSTARRAEFNPCFKVTRGAAVATFAILDSTTGLTITQTYPVVPPPVGDRPAALR
jgi:hypothetical protein